MQYSPPGGAGRSHEQKNHEMAKKTPFFDGFLLPDRLLDHRCGPRAIKILPDVPLAILKVTFFMVKVARTPPSSPKWRGMVIIHQKGGN